MDDIARLNFDPRHACGVDDDVCLSMLSQAPFRVRVTLAERYRVTFGERRGLFGSEVP